MHHVALKLMVAVIWALGVVAIWFIYNSLRTKVAKNDKALKKIDFAAQWLFNGVVTFIVAYWSWGHSIKIDKITVRWPLVTPIFVIAGLVIAKVLIGLYTIPVRKGLLPSSFAGTDWGETEKALDNALDYNDVMAMTTARLMSDYIRDSIVVARFRHVDDAEFVKVLVWFIIKLFDEQCSVAGLDTQFAYGTPEEMNDRTPFRDYSVYMQVVTTVQELDKRYSVASGLCTISLPFILLNQTYIVAMFASRVIPPNVLENYLNCVLSLCENESITSREKVIQRANDLGVTTIEEADQFFMRRSQVCVKVVNYYHAPIRSSARDASQLFCLRARAIFG